MTENSLNIGLSLPDTRKSPGHAVYANWLYKLDGKY